MDLPIEIINLILHYGQFNKKLSSELLKLRLISQRWKDGVEDFCSRIKLLVLQAGTDQKYLSYFNVSSTKATCRRFFGALKVERCLRIEVRHTTSLANCNLAHLILKLFPNVEELIYGAELNDRSVVTNLIFLISRWKNISTLSFKMRVDPQHQLRIASTINSFEKLIRLDFLWFFNIRLLFPTLKRIRHLSLGFNLGSYGELCNIIRQIGPDCSHLWINGVSNSLNPKITSKELLFWKKINVDLCSRLTHFGCSYCSFDSEDAEIISAHFPLLHTIYIDYDNFCCFTQIGNISTLRELRIFNVFFSDLYIQMLENTLRPMANVHNFEFRSIFTNRYGVEDIKKLCITLARLLPNVKHLTIVVQNLAHVEMFKQNLSVFQNLRTFKGKSRPDL